MINDQTNLVEEFTYPSTGFFAALVNAERCVSGCELSSNVKIVHVPDSSYGSLLLGGGRGATCTKI
jgi:hypothetical protein